METKWKKNKPANPGLHSQPLIVNRIFLMRKKIKPLLTYSFSFAYTPWDTTLKHKMTDKALGNKHSIFQTNGKSGVIVSISLTSLHVPL